MSVCGHRSLTCSLHSLVVVVTAQYKTHAIVHVDWWISTCVICVSIRSVRCSMDSLKFVCSWKPTGIPGTKLPVKVS